jgi:membrane associated rhomboid family serine protease
MSLWTSVFGAGFPLTKFFVALCLAVFVASVLGGGGLHLFGLDRAVARQWGALSFGRTPGESLGFTQPWRYLSAMFVHYGALHIAFNLSALWDLGRATEQRLGSARFTLVFVVTGILGFVVSDGWDLVVRGYFAGTAGASGGLFGLMGCLIGYLFARRDPIWKTFLWRLAIMTAIFAIALPVNNAAHVGGFLCGAPMGYLAYKENRPWRLHRAFGWGAGILALASVVSVLLSRLNS